jgi:DNA-binding response OmpR family regulator
MQSPPATILLVEDHIVTRNFLADNLTADGYALVAAESVAGAQTLIETAYPDLVLLDLGLPDGDGLDLVRLVRSADRLSGHIDPDLPLLVLSGRTGELDRLRGFERGADDYVTKPFSYVELRARVAALLRRTRRRPAATRTRVGPLEIDPVSRQVRLRGSFVALSKKEYALLRVLASEPARVFTRGELLRAIWGFADAVPTRTLDSHAFRLRAKLGQDGDRFVINVWGVGYRLLDGGAE